jgi:hypothetical protein
VEKKTKHTHYYIWFFLTNASQILAPKEYLLLLAKDSLNQFIKLNITNAINQYTQSLNNHIITRVTKLRLKKK